MAGNLLTSTTSLRGSGTISEISSGSGKGSESREELQEIAALLGLTASEDLHQNCFRVDRKKLEQMILGNDEAPDMAESFFLNIMEETNTFITWPSKLKIGSKTKKDPHIRVVGRHDDVKTAKEKILAHLETKSNRVTMKLDVSYTDHSHIIGKGGLCIKRVMDETQCHIHFPDSNRSNPIEKSNQVSIAGDVAGVERARAQIRNLTPLIFSFELPIMGCAQAQPNANSPFVMHVSQQYNVQVLFRTRPKLHATLVLVKGAEWEVQKVKDATILLIKHMCESVASQTLVQMSMEISPVHHPLVRGKESTHLKAIMRQTNTQIMFPEISDPNIAQIKKSNVTITGVINNVYLARQQLVGSLPLVLMFDLPEKLSNIRAEVVVQLMSSLDVFINLRQKPKQNTLSVIIKGIERNVSNIYVARHQLLNLDKPCVIADIPQTYHLPDVSKTFGTDYNANCKTLPKQSTSSLSTYSTLSPPGGINPSQVFPSTSLFSRPQKTFPNSYVCSSNRLSPLLPSSHTLPGPYSPNMNLGLLPTSQYNSETKDSGFSSANSSIQSLSPLSSPWCTGNTSTAATRDFATMLSDLSKYDPSTQTMALQSLEYEQRRLAAARAVQSQGLGYRVPTNAWAGYGLSATFPEGLRSEQPAKSSFATKQYEDIWTPSTEFDKTSTTAITPTTVKMNMSNFVDHTPSHTLNTVTTGQWKDLVELLTSFELERYFKLFMTHEIDLATFSTLSDKDLLEIGVHAFGARRKMLLVISELNKRTSPFSGSAAPGAERKSSSTLTGSSGTPDKNW